MYSTCLAEDQLQQVVIHPLLAEESTYHFGASLVPCHTQSAEFCSESLFEIDTGYVKDMVKSVCLWIVDTSSEKLSNNLATIIMGFFK